MYQYFHLICVSLRDIKRSCFKMHDFIFKSACNRLVSTFLSYIPEIESVSKCTYACNNSEYIWKTISLMSVNCTFGSCTTGMGRIDDIWGMDCELYRVYFTERDGLKFVRGNETFGVSIPVDAKSKERKMCQR